MLAIITLLTVLTLSLLILRIATIALCYTGISKEIASFQARSAFTGVGFSTSESEKIMNHPVRRQILTILIILGNAGVVTTIATTLLTFSNLQSNEFGLFDVIFLLGGLCSIWIIARSRWIDRRLSKVIAYALKHYTNLDIRDYNSLLHLTNDYRVTELFVEKKDWIIDQKLRDINLKDEGILILGIQRASGVYLGAPNGETKVMVNDNLVLYGRVNAVIQLDKRRKGRKGDIEHKKAVKEQEIIEEQEQIQEQIQEQLVEAQEQIQESQEHLQEQIQESQELLQEQIQEQIQEVQEQVQEVQEQVQEVQDQVQDVQEQINEKDENSENKS